MAAGSHPVHAPELLAPAGDWECLRAAVANGADAVYFGLPRFNARLRAENFAEEEVPAVAAFCHRHGVKAYVAFNTLVFSSELDAAEAYLRMLSRAGVDAIIVQDIGLAWLARETVPDLPVHASTQMTITSPEGIRFARGLGIERVVLARELSLREIERFSAEETSASMPLEVFVHGALCVAYSGQCLTSEALGQRSANRGECAQACRLPYELIVDGQPRELGGRRYLLSPQDLAAVGEIPALIERGVASFKIEGRLKSPEYVAAVCQVYRRAIDAALGRPTALRALAEETYQLEMAFSRGLFTGWLHGVDHQRLVPARFGKKRGALAGTVRTVGRDAVELDARIPIAPGDGVVFDTGGDPDAEQGGRIYAVRGSWIKFERGHIDFSRIAPGARVWKTDDPALGKRLRASFAGRIEPRRKSPVALKIAGRAGEPLSVQAAWDAPRPSLATVHSTLRLEAARTAPLTEARLREHLGRFGDLPFELGAMETRLEGDVLLPIRELNAVRRQIEAALASSLEAARREVPRTWRELRTAPAAADAAMPQPQLAVLCRSMAHIEAALDAGCRVLYADFEDIRRCASAVARVREATADARILLATPRIQKSGEAGFFRLIENAAPDGVLVRNLGAIAHFRAAGTLRCMGDFSLNVANPLSAAVLMAEGLEGLTLSYDLSLAQVLDLLEEAPPGWFELTLHQHMPMFHMEHCVFAAFLSNGSSHLDCGRPCDHHRVHLRDRVGIEHPLRADVGCRNTLFHAVPQSGAADFEALLRAGLRRFRVELLEEDFVESRRILEAYRALLAGALDGPSLVQELRATSQLGVTRGTLASAPTPAPRKPVGSRRGKP
jgi:putative protease